MKTKDIMDLRNYGFADLFRLAAEAAHRQKKWIPARVLVQEKGSYTIGAGEGIGHIFDDVDTLVKECRFSDCTHTSEPGCAILAALAEDSLTAERWGAYQKLQKEVRYAEEQSLYLKEKRARFKEISKTKRNRPNKKR